MDLYPSGTLIANRYEVAGHPLMGGMGIVYFCYDIASRVPLVLKTFQRGFWDTEAIARFRQESSIWVALEKHPHIVQCHWVQELDHRLFIGMEMISGPDGRSVDLSGWIRQGRLDLFTTLEFAIQICRGMQHAQDRLPGFVHRDLKPQNILVTQNKVVKITDFGLAKALQTTIDNYTVDDSIPANERLLFATRNMVGTPPYMSPEQWRGEPLDMRADIYAFGCMLYEMLTGQLPFDVGLRLTGPRDMAKWYKAWQAQHEHGAVPTLPQSLPTNISEIVHTSMAKEPSARFSNFGILEAALVAACQQVTGKAPSAQLPTVELTAGELCNKGLSLATLGRLEEALEVYDRAIALDPLYVDAWTDKGATLADLNRWEEAIRSHTQALSIDRQFARGWANMGTALEGLGNLDAAIECYDKALSFDSKSTQALANKGNILARMGSLGEALECYEQALSVDPNLHKVWHNKGFYVAAQGLHHEALDYYDRGLILEPRDALAWNNKGRSLFALGRWQEALACCNKALAVDANHAQAWNGKGVCLAKLDRIEDALVCFEKAVKIDPRNQDAINNYGFWSQKASRNQ